MIFLGVEGCNSRDGGVEVGARKRRTYCMIHDIISIMCAISVQRKRSI